MSSALISDTATLAEFIRSVSNAPFVTVDTEFMRDNTYWPKLCLVQVSSPVPGTERAIDPLAEGLDLSPLFELMKNRDIVKVFHAARQDLEIFFNLMDEVPAPIFDSQVAAMVCGYGDQVGYEALVKRICKADMDKSSRFTDWARRPLTDRQLSYALTDVTHLRDIYEFLSASLRQSDRFHWMEEEMAVLSSADTYRLDPENAWRRLKVRNGKPRFLQVLREVAAWRETEAQARDMPRNRVIKDDSLMDVAGSAPKSAEELGRVRGLNRNFAEGRLGRGLLEAVERAMSVPKEDLPKQARQERQPTGLGPTTDLLKVLLKRNCEEAGVAARLIANSNDLELIAADDDADVPALSGWRRDLFGEDALALKRGQIALTVGPKGIDVIRKEA